MLFLVEIAQTERCAFGYVAMLPNGGCQLPTAVHAGCEGRGFTSCCGFMPLSMYWATHAAAAAASSVLLQLLLQLGTR